MYILLTLQKRDSRATARKDRVDNNCNTADYTDTKSYRVAVESINEWSHVNVSVCVTVTAVYCYCYCCEIFQLCFAYADTRLV